MNAFALELLSCLRSLHNVALSSCTPIAPELLNIALVQRALPSTVALTPNCSCYSFTRDLLCLWLWVLPVEWQCKRFDDLHCVLLKAMQGKSDGDWQMSGQASVVNNIGISKRLSCNWIEKYGINASASAGLVLETSCSRGVASAAAISLAASTQPPCLTAF